MFQHLSLFWFFLFSAPLFCASLDPLPSWNEGEAKQAIIQFVNATTTVGNKEYIPLEERIATFDQDGTLWVEKPLYAQFVFAIDMIQVLAKEHPEWKNQEPYQTILGGNLKKIENLTMQDVEKIIETAYVGLTVEEYKERIENWLKFAKHPRFQKPYTELVYQPMLELIQYLKAHGYKVYIVSGGGQDFIRTYSEKSYGIPPENIIGSAGKVKFEYRNGQPVLIKLPDVFFVDEKQGKPEGINLVIGRRPVAAFGNSDGDKEMLEWSQAGVRKSLQLLVHHDDPIREYAYDTNSKIGAFSESLMNEAKKRNWVVVSMKNDWKIIFPWEKKMQLSYKTCIPKCPNPFFRNSFMTSVLLYNP